MTPEQVLNWRRVLCGMLGPYALIMSDDEINKIRDKMQSELGNNIDKPVARIVESKPFNGINI